MGSKSNRSHDDEDDDDDDGGDDDDEDDDDDDGGPRVPGPLLATAQREQHALRAGGPQVHYWPQSEKKNILLVYTNIRVYMDSGQSGGLCGGQRISHHHHHRGCPPQHVTTIPFHIANLPL